MSVLRVLTVGENPNILLYTSRFNLASSVELYHVSSIPSDTFQITTNAYGTETCRLRYKFDSVSSLVKYIRTNVPGEALAMDLIILSASTLQEVNTLASQLLPLVNNATKIFLESTGFVQLESFVRLSIRNSQVSIFSLLTDIDMRASGPCQYEQFNTRAGYGGNQDTANGGGAGSSSTITNSGSNRYKPNTIYLGDSTSPSHDQYDQTAATLLRTFKRLSQKLFTSEVIDLCNLSPREYTARQWLFAIPNICFNPLMIFLEKSSAKKLIAEILAKPLISGLISETTQVIRQTGITLREDGDNGRVLQTEAELTEYWLDLYSGEKQIPALLYPYIKRTAPLNSDIRLLQVILLADTFKIRTPYLEFLYTTMTQYERINAGKSKWVERVGANGNRDGNAEETAKSMKELATRMTSERDKYLLQVEKLTKEREAMSDRIDSLTQREYNLTEQVRELQEKLTALENDRDRMLSEQKSEIANLQRELQKLSVAGSGIQQQQQQQQQPPTVQTSAYKTTGTPNLTDLTDMALFGAKLADSKAGSGSMLTPTVAPTPGNYGRAPQTSQPQAQPRSTGSGRETRHDNESNSSESEERMLKERELELREKELELQERELELQKRSMDQQQRMQKMNRLTVQQQQQHQQQYPPHMIPAQQGYPNPSRKSSYNQLQNMQLQQQQQQQYMQHPRPGRALHGVGNANQMAMQSASHFVDPVGSGVAHMNGAYNQHPNPHQSVMMGKQPNLPTMPQMQPHAFKATSRKNKNNGLAMLGNASSVSVDTYSTPGQIQPPNRLNSLPGQNVLNPYNRQPRSVTPTHHDNYRANSAMTMGVNPYNNNNRTLAASTTGGTNVGPGWSNTTN